MNINCTNNAPFEIIYEWAHKKFGWSVEALSASLDVSSRTVGYWRKKYTPAKISPEYVCERLFFKKDKNDKYTDLHHEMVNSFLAYLAELNCFVPTEWRDGFAGEGSEFKNYFTSFLLEEEYIDKGEVFPVNFHQLIDRGFTPIDVAKQLVENDQRLYGEAARNSGVLKADDNTSFSESSSENFSPANAGTAAQWSQYLSSWPDSFEYLVNSKNKIIGNYSMLSCTDEQYRKLLDGEISECDLKPTETRSLYQADTTHILFILNMSVNVEYNSIENSVKLRAMFWNKIANYAQNRVLFKKMIVNVFHPAHESYYKSLGFEFKGAHKKGGRIYELNMFPYPQTLSDVLSQNPAYFAANKILKKAYRFTCIQLTSDFKLTDMQLCDISKLIYQTDENIYPCVFDGVDAACQVLPGLIESGADKMFRKENLYVAFNDERVVGIILHHKGAVGWEKQQLIEETSKLRLPSPPGFDRACDEYLSSYNKTPESVRSVINVCIAEEFRGAKLGSMMFNKFVDIHRDEGDMELFVLAENSAAHKVYEDAGFDDLLPPQQGFARDTSIDLPCIKMIYTKKK